MFKIIITHQHRAYCRFYAYSRYVPSMAFLFGIILHTLQIKCTRYEFLESTLIIDKVYLIYTNKKCTSIICILL